jgi:hypothetical protein
MCLLQLHQRRAICCRRGHGPIEVVKPHRLFCRHCWRFLPWPTNEADAGG